MFVTYAHADKGVADELADELEALGITAWIDKTELTIGKGIRRSIDHGLAHSRFAVALMSRAFFSREWTQIELDGIVASRSPAASRSCRSGTALVTTTRLEEVHS